jgi:protein-disulfide isomerase
MVSGNENTGDTVKHQETTGSNPWMIISVFLGILLIVSFLTNIYIFSKVTNLGALPSGGQVPSPSPSAGNQPTGPAPKVDVSADDDPAKGDKNAPVTIIEFSDFECPFCGRWFTQTYPQLKSEYIDTGKVRLVYRDFPLGFHPNAQKAAEAAECADEQGKFWEMHDKIFANQQAIAVANLKQYAKDLGLDSSKFDSCLDSDKYASEVQKDYQDGTAAGVSGTPSFFINGQLVVGAQPYSVFKQAIDAELNQ